MPYSKLSKNSSNLRKSIKKSKSARAQQRQLSRVNARIDSLALKVLDQKSTYGMKLEETPLALDPLTNYRAIPICPTLQGSGNYSVWGNCFSAGEKAYDSERVRLGRCYTKMGFYSNSESGPNNFSVFHVKLQPETMDELITSAGEDLSSLTTDIHYITGHGTDVTSGVGSHVQLNPRFFRTQKKWNFTLVNKHLPGGAAHNLGTNTIQKIIEYSFPLGYKIGSDGSKWRTMSAPDSHELDKRNFILIFCDNSSLDAENPSYRILAQCNASA